MALPVTVPNTFANATASIPLSQLDANFSTLSNAINGINSGAETLVNLKASNVTITGGTFTGITAANIAGANISSGNATFTNVTVTQANATTANVTTLQTANAQITGGNINNVTLANVTIANSSVTNTSVQVRVSSTANAGANLVWNSANFDQFVITAQSAALNVNADSGSPSDGQKSIFRIKDNGSAYAITWNTASTNGFRAIGITLPTTTVATKTVYVGCIYNSNAARWDAVATAQEA